MYDGICLSILDTAGNYEDILTDTYLTYSYPDTKHESPKEARGS